MNTPGDMKFDPLDKGQKGASFDLRSACVRIPCETGSKAVDFLGGNRTGCNSRDALQRPCCMTKEAPLIRPQIGAT